VTDFSLLFFGKSIGPAHFTFFLFWSTLIEILIQKGRELMKERKKQSKGMIDCITWVLFCLSLQTEAAELDAAGE
jgi:hypothetical protein